MNSGIELTLKIKEIEEVELRSERKPYIILNISTQSTNPEEGDFLFHIAGIGSERLLITIDGQD
ncbi:hypothetical protein WJU16_22530 [Chitinophaga pollutisoli]|uniref:Uncharacterized protein n=1 Tax=Chitinophaga pollutisoli TaxID=3133966 RepID=A0ABZ2YMK5_9BACT